MAADPASVIPLKPLVFQILLGLTDGERHGWSLVREILEQDGPRVLPANFYRTLRTMMADGLIEESGRARPAEDDERRRYFRLTTLGQQVAKLEARRLQAIVADVRTRRLLSTRRS